MALRCVYTDLDGTLLGAGASLFRDGEGEFTLLPARALEACHRAGVEVVLKSGRRKAQVMEDARLIGQDSLHLRGRLRAWWWTARSTCCAARSPRGTAARRTS